MPIGWRTSVLRRPPARPPADPASGCRRSPAPELIYQNYIDMGQNVILLWHQFGSRRKNRVSHNRLQLRDARLQGGCFTPVSTNAISREITETEL